MKASNGSSIRLNAPLRPINRDLTDKEVLELYHSGRAIYVETEEDEEVIELMNKAVNRTMRCRNMIASGKKMEVICSYFKKVFGGEDRLDAVNRMRDASKRKQFICEQVGVLMEMGVIFGGTQEVAKALGYKSIALDSIMRYIRRGKQLSKNN